MLIPFFVITTALLFASFCLIGPPYLFSWDSIQFALGLEHFDMAIHQPHPPGHIGHLAIGALFLALGQPFDRAMVFASASEGALSCLALGLLARGLYGGRAASLSFALFATHPFLWFYAISGEAYPGEALSASLIVLLASFLERGFLPWLCPLLWFFFGLLASIRQSLLFFFAPFVLHRTYVAIKRSGLRPLRVLIPSLLALTFGLLVWAVPLLLITKGPKTLGDLFVGQFIERYGHAYSPLLKGDLSLLLSNLEVLCRRGLYALSIGGLLGAILPIFVRKVAKEVGHKTVLALWLLPPLSFFLLMYLPKPGHLMVLLPCLCMWAGVRLSALYCHVRKEVFAGLLSSILLGQMALFVSPPEWVLKNLSPTGWPVVERATKVTGRAIEAVKMASEGDPSSVLIVTHDGPFTFRRAMYYLPDFEVLWLEDEFSTGIDRGGVDICWARYHRVKCVNEEAFWTRRWMPKRARYKLGPQVKKVLWFAKEDGPLIHWLMEKTKVFRISRDGETVVFGTLVPQGSFRLEVGPYTFER